MYFTFISSFLLILTLKTFSKFHTVASEITIIAFNFPLNLLEGKKCRDPSVWVIAATFFYMQLYHISSAASVNWMKRKQKLYLAGITSNMVLVAPMLWTALNKRFWMKLRKRRKKCTKWVLYYHWLKDVVCLSFHSAFSTEIFSRSVFEMQTGFVLSGLESRCTWHYRLLGSMAELKAKELWESASMTLQVFSNRNDSMIC